MNELSLHRYGSQDWLCSRQVQSGLMCMKDGKEIPQTSVKHISS